MTVEYKGTQTSIYKLAKLTGCPTSTLYKAQKDGCCTGEEIVMKAREHLIEYKGEFMSLKKICEMTGTQYATVRKRLSRGLSIEESLSPVTGKRGGVKETKLTVSDVIDIYVALFNKSTTQCALSLKYGVHKGTICDVWQHRRWGWITAPLRYELES